MPKSAPRLSRSPGGFKQGMGYRAIGGELAKAGHVNERGRPFHHKSVRAMLVDR